MTTTNNAMLPLMLTVHDVAAILGCSPRSIYRLCDASKMPRPVKLGALVRWPREVVEKWIAAGCPAASESQDIHARKPLMCRRS